MKITNSDWHNEFLDHEQDRANSWLCDNTQEEGEMKLSYFAEDGNYGTCEVLVVNTENWTAEDWEAIENATDLTRIDVANKIDDQRRQGRD